MSKELIKHHENHPNQQALQISVQRSQRDIETATHGLSKVLTDPIIGSSTEGNMSLVIPNISKNIPNDNSTVGGKNKELVVRQDQTSITKKDNEIKPFKVPNRPTFVLEENKYVSDLEKIIVRDFFPDADPEGAISATAPKERLNEYQQKYTSEDNDSFNTLIEKQVQHSREKAPWFWDPETFKKDQKLLRDAKANKESPPDASLLLLEDSRRKKVPAKPIQFEPDVVKTRIDMENDAIAKTLGWIDPRESQLDSWPKSKSTPAGPINPLMFPPINSAKGLTKKQIKDQSQKRIDYTKTRFSENIATSDQDQINKPKIQDNNSDSSGHEKPLVNGYSFVTPTTTKNSITPQTDDTDKQFTMLAPPEKEAIRDRLIERKAQIRRQERQLASASFLAQSLGLTSNSSSSSLRKNQLHKGTKTHIEKNKVNKTFLKKQYRAKEKS